MAEESMTLEEALERLDLTLGELEGTEPADDDALDLIKSELERLKEQNEIFANVIARATGHLNGVHTQVSKIRRLAELEEG